MTPLFYTIRRCLLLGLIVAATTAHALPSDVQPGSSQPQTTTIAPTVPAIAPDNPSLPGTGQIVTSQPKKDCAIPKPSEIEFDKLGNVIWHWITCNYGRFELILAVSAIGLFKFWKPLTTASKAGKRWIKSRCPLPKANSGQFNLALVHLAGDKEYAMEKLILADVREYNGINLLRFERTLVLDTELQPEQSELKGHEQAQRLLQESGADVLIWGEVQKQDDKSAPQLFWTASATPRQPRTGDIYPPENFRLPPAFWDQLKAVLALRINTVASRFRGLEGQYLADQLQPFIEQVQRLLEPGEHHPEWNPDQRAAILLALADARQTLGQQTGNNDALRQAIDDYDQVLRIQTRERVPLDWARTQNSLGNALWSLGQRESGTARLEAAVTAYQAALQERTREQVPLQWARTQNNLGNALWSLGQRESGTARLEAAVTAYQAALQEWTRERVPLQWATTQNNLGNALTSLGERESGTARLEAAVTACQAALQEWTRKRVPLQWAMTQNIDPAL